jgi:hypothetical protein
VLIQVWESRECYYLDGTTKHFCDCNETIWLGNPLSFIARQAQSEAIDQLLETDEIGEQDVEAAKTLVVEVDVQARNRILYQVKQKIQSNLLDEASNLLKLLEKYYLTDIYIIMLLRFHLSRKTMLKSNIGENNTFTFQMIKSEKEKLLIRKSCLCLMLKWNLIMKNLRNGIGNCSF